MRHEFTDAQRKKIIADYIMTENYTETGRRNGLTRHGVKRIVESSPEFKEECKKQHDKNTADIFAYMETQKQDVCDFLELAMEQLKNPEKLKKAQLQQIATTMAIVIDKYTAFRGGPVDSKEEDELSKSLRELGKELESDA